MGEGTFGMALLVALTAVIAMISHWRISRFLDATLAAACIATGVFLAIAIVQSGPQPLIGIAVIVSAVIAFGVSVVVGLPFLAIRRRRQRLRIE
jgi:hypothetical protein